MFRTHLHWRPPRPVLYREGDYLGATVNVAARITGEAVAHQILTTADIATGASGSDVTFRPPGPRRLRGIANDIEIYELHTTTRSDDDSTWPAQLFVDAPGRHAAS